MTKKHLLMNVYLHLAKGDDWLDTVPSEISASYYDNPYIAESQIALEDCLSFIFAGEEYEWVCWFLHEWKNNKELSISIDGEEFSFHRMGDVVDFFFDRGLIKEASQ